MTDLQHLTDDDLLRILAFEAADDDLARLEAHASACDACAARLAQAAELELLCIETAARRESREKPRRFSRRGAVGAAGAVLALAAATILGLRGWSRDAIVAEPGGVQMAAPTNAANDAWFITGSHPGRFAKSLEVDPSRASGRARVLRSVAPPEGPDDFGTLMQTFSAVKFRGKRIRFSADVRTSDVTGWSGLWMRVDRGSNSVAFDNMANRAIRGTTSWARHHVVLDVADNADAISLGVLVNGEGTALIADPRVEVVGRDVPVTVSGPRPLASDFSE